MSVTTTPLTVMKIEAAKPQAKNYRLSDGNGLTLLITPAGGKHWRVRYFVNKREKTLTLGSWPKLSLADARIKCGEAKDNLWEGDDPAVLKRREKEALTEAQDNTFQAIGDEWMNQKADGWSAKTGRKIKSRIKEKVYPYIGKMPITDIKSADILSVVHRIERTGKKTTARRVWRDCRAICAYAVVSSRAEYNVAAGLESALASHKVTHHPAPTEQDDVAAVIKKLYSGYSRPVTDCAVRLLPLFFVRPGELVSARWDQMDLEEGTWKFKASKNGPDQIVPLATQAIKILKEVRKITGDTEFVFASQHKRGVHLDAGTLNHALKVLGVTADVVTPHGFRATARTVLDEQLKYPPERIEQQLSHVVRDALGRAYNRTTYLEERREMMQAWADYLDDLKGGTKGSESS